MMWNVSICKNDAKCIPSFNHTSTYEESKPLFWCFVSVCIVIAIIGIIGNGLVIYASHQSRSSGRFRYLDSVIKSLAVTDFLFGLVGTPLIITTYYLGKLTKYTINNFMVHRQKEPSLLFILNIWLMVKY